MDGSGCIGEEATDLAVLGTLAVPETSTTQYHKEPTAAIEWWVWTRAEYATTLPTRQPDKLEVFPFLQ